MLRTRVLVFVALVLGPHAAVRAHSASPEPEFTWVNRILEHPAHFKGQWHVAVFLSGPLKARVSVFDSTLCQPIVMQAEPVTPQVGAEVSALQLANPKVPLCLLVSVLIPKSSAPSLVVHSAKLVSAGGPCLSLPSPPPTPAKAGG